MDRSNRLADFAFQGTPTTLLRIPYEPLIPTTTAVPSPMVCLARTMPLVAPQQAPNAPPPPYSTHAPAPIGWAVNDAPAGNDRPAETLLADEIFFQST